MSQITKRSHLTVHINGETLNVSDKDAFLPLAQFLRNSLSKVGTKVVCAEGDCGACSVVASHYRNGAWTPLRTINSCIAPVFLFDLACIVTVEGLKDSEGLSEVQNKMREFHGGQCGFCTPGMVCSMAQLAEDCSAAKTEVTEKKARNYLTGNLCRCTGYEPILAAATHLELGKWKTMKERYLTAELTSQFKTLQTDGIEIVFENKKLTLPTDLASAVSLRQASPTSRIVAGATDIGVLVNKAKTSLQEILVLNKVSELHKIENTSAGVFIGAQVSLTDVEEFVRTSHPELKRLLHIFASPQIKNQGTLLGNVLNGSPIGDSIPALMALDAEIQFASKNGTRKVALKNYYKGYKVFDKTDDEIAVGILIPTLKGEYLNRFFKVSLRKDLDISAVTFAAVLKVQDGTLSEARIAMGGVGPCVIRLPQVEQHLVGKAFNEKTFADAGVLAASLITPISDLRASREYRQLVTENLFKKCFHELSVENTVAEGVCP